MSEGERYLEYAGQFRLVRKIAVGGMATVYEAEQLGPSGFAKRTALKVIHPQYAKQKEWLQLFIDEAKQSGLKPGRHLSDFIEHEPAWATSGLMGGWPRHKRHRD